MQAKKKFLIQSTAFALFLAVVGYFAGPGISQSIQQPAHVLGAFTANDCAKVNAAGFIVSNGSACGAAAGTVTTGVTLTANLPVIGAGGSAIAVGTRSGNTTQYVTTTGTLTSGDCVKIDASGNFIANGSACGGGGGALTWTGLSFQNSWSDYGSSYQTGQYAIDGSSIVHLRGLIKGGTLTAGTVMANLPAGFRPTTKQIVFNGCQSAVTVQIVCQIDVGTNGDVILQTQPTGGAGSFVALFFDFGTN